MWKNEKTQTWPQGPTFQPKSAGKLGQNCAYLYAICIYMCVGATFSAGQYVPLIQSTQNRQTSVDLVYQSYKMYVMCVFRNVKQLAL